jgi:2-polyprenyl-3-methyl-5-hydroxy-6-metoxy-1,4-benzoquinol methylase
MMNIKTKGLNYLTENYPLLAKMAFQGANSEFRGFVSSYLEEVQAVSEVEVKTIMDAYAQTCFEFMRLQNSFLKTGRYSSTSQVKLESNLYAKVDSMKPYLLGLLSTYLYWENHSKIFDFFCEEFGTVAESLVSPNTMEIGTGHGLFASYLLEKNSKMSYLGIDISKSSLDFSSMLLEKRFPGRQVTLLEQDATSSKFTIENRYDLVICCEVLEHVENPDKLLLNILSSLTNEGKAFITTVSNLEAIDHIYLFKNSQEIRELIEKNGFTILEERIFHLPNSTSEVEQSNYAAIIAPISNLDNLSQLQ